MILQKLCIKLFTLLIFCSNIIRVKSYRKSVEPKGGGDIGGSSYRTKCRGNS